ncbi:protein FAM133A-like [Leptopilina heterotoma]|uniref:protein FAM133A-like n=1 Tax=Leptopilina heterotoma TaxID=63436 RepID=UPI001CA941E9|nr:protein FAM133A-like [Leptopilina heterotoma]
MNSSSDEYQRAGKRRRQHSGDRFPKKREKSREKVKRRSRSRKRRPSTSSRSSSSSTERGSREFSRRTKNSERLRRETPRRTLPASRSGERHPRGAPRKRSRYNDSNLDRNRYDSVSESSVSSHPDERSSSSPPRDETEKPAHETTQSGKNQPGTEEKIDKQASVEVDNADPLLSQLDSTEFEKKATGAPVNDSVSKLWSNIFKTGFKSHKYFDCQKSHQHLERKERLQARQFKLAGPSQAQSQQTETRRANEESELPSASAQEIERATPTRGQTYPGGRTVIKEGFKMRRHTEETDNIMLSSLSNRTLNEYIECI